jgi:hypothetical protein
VGAQKSRRRDRDSQWRRTRYGALWRWPYLDLAEKPDLALFSTVYDTV